MKKNELRDKVELLKAGQRVEIDGNIFSAKRMHPAFHCSPCDKCNVDCMCRGNIAEVCTTLDFMSKTVWYLHLEK